MSEGTGIGFVRVENLNGWSGYFGDEEIFTGDPDGKCNGGWQRRSLPDQGSPGPDFANVERRIRAKSSEEFFRTLK